MTEQPEEHDWHDDVKDASPYLTIGIQLAGAMLFYVAVGYFLDRWLDTKPWLLVAGSVVGMIVFFIQLIRITKDVSKREHTNEEKE